MAEFRLPRLVRAAAIATREGLPSLDFTRWWQSVVTKLEGVITDLQQAIADILLAQAAADAAQVDADAAVIVAAAAQTDATDALNQLAALDIPEQARDALGTALTAGAGVTITPNDVANTITVASTITQYTDEMARDTLGTALTAGTGITITPNDGADTITVAVSMAAIKPTESLIIACSDETTAITTGTAKVTFRMPYAFTLSAVRASVTTAPTGSTILIDINETSTTILSTKLMIDASEKTSTTATTPAVISDTSLADDAEITIDFDQVGSTIAGAGVKVYLIGNRT